MASVKANPSENLQHRIKLHLTRNVMISGFSLAFLLFLILLILDTNGLSASSSLLIRFSNTSLASWSFSLPNAALSSFTDKNNATHLGNFGHRTRNGVIGNQAHYVNLDLGVKNESSPLSRAALSTSVDKNSDATHLGNFGHRIKNGVRRNHTHFANLDLGVKNVSSPLPNAALSSNVDKNSDATNLGNSMHEVEDTGVMGNKTHFANPEFEVKNVSFYGREATNITDGEINTSRNSSNRLDFDTRLAKEHKNDGGSVSRECDIFDGRWGRDDRLPHYPPGSCPHIDTDFNCHLNGRRDTEFYRWKWQPYGCNIPRLNATDFLERLRGKKLVFVGDSLNRNMWESLVCVLRNSVNDKTRVYEISGKSEFKKDGYYAFRFENYNCSVDYVRTPFLARESSFKGKKGPFPTLRLDLMDETTKMYQDAHILVFNTGHWWTHEKTSRGEHYYQEGNYVHPRLEADQAYERALTTWSKWIDRHVDRNKTLVFFRGYSNAHFSGGEWNTGGQCHKETKPTFDQSELEEYPPKMRSLELVLQKMKTPVVYLNISRLTDYRKDAHPSIYRKPYKTAEELAEAERSQDCSHWCLPGVPDIWNELLYAFVVRFGWGSSS